jgi:hypothetical protein
MIPFGHGAPEEFVKWMGNRYIDLAQVATQSLGFRQSTAYHDFEGFADPDHTDAILEDKDVKEAIAVSRVDLVPVITDLLAHYVYENEDQGDYKVNVEEACTFVCTVDWLFTCRFWLKRDAEETNEEPEEVVTRHQNGTVCLDPPTCHEVETLTPEEARQWRRALEAGS